MNGIQGNDAAQARVFAHDAVNIVVGAINWSATNGGLEITTAGTEYALEDEITLAAGSGTSAKFLVKAINSAGGVTRLEQKPISAPLTYESGAGYALASTPVASGGSGTAAGLAVKVVDIDIPNTQQRGVCLFVGAAAGLSDLSVIMESGRLANFKSLSGGTVLPVLVTRVTQGGLTANDVLALY
jgi:hypothetical protein